MRDMLILLGSNNQLAQESSSDNNCRTAFCISNANNVGFIADSKDSNAIDQKTSSQNDCSKTEFLQTTCVNAATNTGTIQNSEESSISQKFENAQ